MDAYLRKTADYIATTQLPSGAIPWFAGGITDPWDHVEAIMGLNVGGHPEGAIRGLRWLQQTQSADGSWFAAYTDKTVADDTRAETNFVAYVATGVWHTWLSTGKDELLEEFWPMVSDAMQFVLTLQSSHGEIYWAKDARKGISHDALITGCSSIFKSLACAINIGRRLGVPVSHMHHARQRLGQAVASKPERFDRTWASKARYSMDWFYPVLSGIYTGAAAKKRLDKRWQEFVQPGLGCKCVVEEPWVTVAETCELVMACVAAGDIVRAQKLFSDLAQFQVEDGSWWTGYVYPDQLFWPDERPTWTAAAILLAADALFQLSPAHRLFSIPDAI